MPDRLLFLPVAIALGLGAAYLKLGYAGLGILAGVAIFAFSMLRGQSFAPAFETGSILVGIGLACYWGGYFFARKHGMSLDELAAARSSPEYLRRLPYYGITAITMGVILMVLDIANRPRGDEQ
jgi:hypothetical protein